MQTALLILVVAVLVTNVWVFVVSRRGAKGRVATGRQCNRCFRTLAETEFRVRVNKGQKPYICGQCKACENKKRKESADRVARRVHKTCEQGTLECGQSPQNEAAHADEAKKKKAYHHRRCKDCGDRVQGFVKGPRCYACAVKHDQCRFR